MKAIKKEVIEQRLKEGESLRSIAKSLGVAHQTLQYHRKRWGCKPLREATKRGKEHHSWRGGFYIDRWGYKMILARHRDCSNPYTAEHVLIVEKHLGRQLIKHKEVVHHINGDKSDNRIENLLVCSRSQHRRLHRQFETIGYELMKQGQIVFDGESYVLVS